MSLSRDQFGKLLDDLVCDYCGRDYCFLKQLLLSLHPSERVLIQVKCIDKFKWEKGYDSHVAIGEQEAWQMWSLDGYAEAFAEVYDENLSVKEIYKKTLELAEKRKAENSETTDYQ
jgi:hypothetical protein